MENNADINMTIFMCAIYANRKTTMYSVYTNSILIITDNGNGTIYMTIYTHS